MIDKLTIDDVPENLKSVAYAIGIDAFKDLVRLASGSNLYILNESSVVKPFRNKMIRESF